MSEFSTQFKAEVHLMFERVQALAGDEKLLRLAHELDTLVARLPDDPVAFAWVIRYCYERLRGAFIALKHRFSVMKVRWKLGRYRQFHIEDLSDYLTLFWTTSEQVTSLYKQIADFIRGQKQLYEGQRLIRDQTIAPQRLITIIEPLLRNIVLSRDSAWRSFIPEVMAHVSTPVPREKRQVSCVMPAFFDDAMVRYHAFYTIELFATIGMQVFSRLINIEHLWIGMSFDESSLIVSLASPSITMRPRLWNELYSLLFWHPELVYERLRDMGGFIEPLTWDEGQGQGVVVTLPWAVSLPKP